MKCATKKLRSPVKWHGGKSYLARRIIALFPEHRVYVEPFLGGGSILLNKPRAGVEVAGDVDGKLLLFWSVVAHHDFYWRFWDRLRETEYAEDTFRAAKAGVDHAPARPWEQEEIPWPIFAVSFLARNRMSRGGLGRDFAWSERLRGGQPGDLNAWQTILGEMPAIHKRVSDVKFVLGPAVETIARFDAPDALIYCDPPYLHETRTAKKAYGPFEMTPEQHLELLAVLLACTGKVFLSGYRSALYDEALYGWTRHEFNMPNHSGQGKTKQRRIECLWESPS